jgi:hypothetical protein
MGLIATVVRRAHTGCAMIESLSTQTPRLGSPFQFEGDH